MMWDVNQQQDRWAQKPKEEDKIVRTMRVMIADPNDVGGVLRTRIGTNEAEERRKSVRFKNDRRRFGRDDGFLRLEEDDAIV